MFAKDFLKKYGVYVLTMLAWAIIVILVPYAADDWTWGSEEGMYRLHRNFSNYNGRYLGNCIIIVLMRSSVLRVVVMSVLNTLIPIFIEKITKVKINYSCSLLLFLVMNIDMWAMTTVWTAGFANYITSACSTLMLIVYIFRVIEDKYEKKSNIKLTILFVILGLINTLIVEHMTLYNVALAMFILIYVYIKEKKVYIQHIAYFISCVIGTVIMFSNLAYRNLTTDNKMAHNMNKDFLTQVKINYFGEIYKFAFSFNIWINLLILVLLYVILKKNKELFTDRSKKLLKVYTVYFVWSFISNTGVINSYTYKLIYLDGFFALIGFVSLISLLLRVFWKTTYRVHMIFLLSSIILHCGIMIRIHPVTSRCLLMAYILWMLVVGFMVKYVYENKYLEDEIFVKTRKCFFVIISLLGIFYTGIYFTMCRADSYRLKYIDRKVREGSEEIYIKKLPFQEYLHGSDYDANVFGFGTFKDFYGIPKDIAIIQYDEEDKYFKNN